MLHSIHIYPCIIPLSFYIHIHTIVEVFANALAYSIVNSHAQLSFCLCLMPNPFQRTNAAVYCTVHIDYCYCYDKPLPHRPQTQTQTLGIVIKDFRTAVLRGPKLQCSLLI
jgi:hypothetical protein